MLLQDGFVEEKSYCSGCRCFGHLSYQLHFRPEKEFSCPWTMATAYFPLRYRWSLFHTPRACAHMFTVHRLRSVVLCIRHHCCAVTLQTIRFISRSVCSICDSQWRIKFFSCLILFFMHLFFGTNTVMYSCCWFKQWWNMNMQGFFFFFFQLKPVGCLIVSGVFACLALNISGRGCDYSSARGRCKRDTPVRPFFSVMLASW